MKKFGPKYIGQVTLQSVRGWILDNFFTEHDTVLLHPANMATVLDEYQQLYREPMPNPYFLLGVLIEQAPDAQVPANRVAALLQDDRPHRPKPPQPAGPSEPTDDGSEVFRCDNCGSLVDAHGMVLAGNARVHAMSLLRLRDGGGAMHVPGECCQQADEEDGV